MAQRLSCSVPLEPSWIRQLTPVCCIDRQIFTTEPAGKHPSIYKKLILSQAECFVWLLLVGLEKVHLRS